MPREPSGRTRWGGWLAGAGLLVAGLALTPNRQGAGMWVLGGSAVVLMGVGLCLARRAAGPSPLRLEVVARVSVGPRSTAALLQADGCTFLWVSGPRDGELRRVRGGAAKNRHREPGQPALRDPLKARMHS